MSTTEEGISKEDWAGDVGRNWLANLNRFEAMIQPIGAELIRQADFRPGETVIDIGCGGGATTIALARSVSPGGSATGLDISRELIDHAGVRAAMGTQSRLFWICGDASTVMPTNAPFDRLISRFGTMFFSDPVAAFRNLRAMLKPSARIDLAVWAPQLDNPWIRTIMGALNPLLPEGAAPDPRAPGPFAFADTAYLEDVLTQAGFADMAVTPCERDQPIGGTGATPEQAAEFVLGAMSVAATIPEDKRDAALAAVTAALAPHHVPGKGVILGGKAWIVTATAI